MRLFDPIRATQFGAGIKTAFMKIAGVDVAIVGFPKCGNTWYSALIRHLLIERFDLDRSKMGTFFVSDRGAWPFPNLPRAVPRIYQSHCMPYPMEIGLRGTRESLSALSNIPMIILRREHKDAMVSYFMHRSYRGTVYSGSISDFIRSPIFGIEKFVAYYNTVFECRSEAKATTVVRTYEDLWEDPLSALKEDCRFIGIEGVGDVQLQRVIDSCSFQNMRNMELSATPETSVVPGLYRAAHEHDQAFKVRKGGVGNWTERLCEHDAAYLDAFVNSHLHAETFSRRRGATKADAR
jgi:hypothetical protein